MSSPTLSLPLSSPGLDLGHTLGPQEGGSDVRRLSLFRVLGGYPEKDGETAPYPWTDPSLVGFFNLMRQ